MTLTKKDINTIKDYFKDKPVLMAFLFGSYVRQEASDTSDIDIMVELDYSQHIGLGFVSIKLDLEERLGKKIDLISSNAVYKYILPFINKDKTLIYQR